MLEFVRQILIATLAGAGFGAVVPLLGGSDSGAGLAGTTCTGCEGSITPILLMNQGNSCGDTIGLRLTVYRPTPGACNLKTCTPGEPCFFRYLMERYCDDCDFFLGGTICNQAIPISTTPEPCTQPGTWYNLGAFDVNVTCGKTCRIGHNIRCDGCPTSYAVGFYAHCSPCVL